MSSLIYIHGFLSSPQSFKARQLQQWLAAHRPDVQWHCPHLTPYPEQTRHTLETLVDRCLAENQPVGVMGSSLGGFWATWLAETRNVKAVLVNPSVSPWQFMPEYLHRDLTAWHGETVYRLNETHVEEIRACERAILLPHNYWLLVQTGDETLDYSRAVARYRDCRQTVEDGGDHSFQGFERYHQQAIEFLLGPAAMRSDTAATPPLFSGEITTHYG